MVADRTYSVSFSAIGPVCSCSGAVESSNEGVKRPRQPSRAKERIRTLRG